jgi:hypothetical protein
MTSSARILISTGALLGSLAVVSCEVPKPPPCPGTAVATLQFEGVATAPIVGPPRCTFTQQPAAGELNFGATISHGDAPGSASLCLDRASAAPLTGTRADDSYAFSSKLERGTIQDCKCPVDVVDSVQGTVTRGTLDGGDGGEDGGTDEVIGFDGELTTVISASPQSPDAGTSDGGADGGDGGVVECGCSLPCQVRYKLTATR